MSKHESTTLPTIFEVAQAAGVSITTVSHVFSGNRPVNEETRRRVIETSERLGYRASRNARGLATGRSMAVAVQLPMTAPDILMNPYFSYLLPAMSEAAVALGYAFVLVPPNPAEESFIRPLVTQRGVDAAILIDPRPGDAFHLSLREAEVPTVSLGRAPELPDAPRVDQDFETAMQDVSRHLGEEGYRRTAFLTIPDDIASIGDIRRAYEEHFEAPEVAVAEDYSDDAATDAALALLDRPDRPDAVICITERQALGVYRAVRELDLTVPADVGVVSFGESSVSRGMIPPATSVCVFPESAGRELIGIVDRLLSREDVAEVTLVPTELLVRGSTKRRG